MFERAQAFPEYPCGDKFERHPRGNVNQRGNTMWHMTQNDDTKLQKHWTAQCVQFFLQ